MCSFVPHLICASRTSWQAGKEVLQMAVSGRMRESQIFAFLQDGITSEMQDSHPVMHSLFHIEEFGTTSRNGCRALSGMLLITLTRQASLRKHFTRPQNYKELFNLQHATARNIAERILRVMKREPIDNPNTRVLLPRRSSFAQWVHCSTSPAHLPTTALLFVLARDIVGLFTWLKVQLSR